MYNKVKRVEKPKQDQPQHDEERMTITVEQLAQELHISRPTAYNLVKQKGFPAFTIGKRVLINKQALQNWMDKKCTEMTEV